MSLIVFGTNGKKKFVQISGLFKLCAGYLYPTGCYLQGRMRGKTISVIAMLIASNLIVSD